MDVQADQSHTGLIVGFVVRWLIYDCSSLQPLVLQIYSHLFGKHTINHLFTNTKKKKKKKMQSVLDELYLELAVLL